MKATPAPKLLALTCLSLLLGPGCQKQTSTTSQPTTPSVNGAPKLAVKDTVLNAGDVDYAVPRDFTFRVGNTGTAALHLRLLRRSCSCGDVDMPAQEIAPGNEGTIHLRWKPIPGKTGSYTLSVEIQTDDPQTPHLRLEVRGQINPLVRLVPEDWSMIDFGLVKPGQVASRELRLVSAKLATLDVEAQTSHPGLTASVSKLAAEAGGDFKSGHTVVVRTSAGLPSGYFRESLTLKVRMPGEPAREIVLPVYGEVENGVFQVMPQEVEFRKPKVTDEDSKRVRVQFLVPSEAERLEVAGCEPSFLQWDPPTRLRPGLWEFAVRLPSGNAAAAAYQVDGFFEGRVLLRASGLPQA